MSWYDTGLVMDLAPLDTAGAITAMLLDVGYTHNPADDLTVVSLVESSGGSYTRQVVPDVTLDVSTPGLARLMSPSATAFPRPTSSPGWIVLYATATSDLILAAPFTDSTLDPIEVWWRHDVIGSRVVDD